MFKIGFYDVLTLVDYSMPNFVYRYILNTWFVNAYFVDNIF